MLIAAVSFGCAGAPPETAAVASTKETPVMEPILGTSWKATKIAGKPADAADTILNVAEDGSVNGTTGCNSFQGPAEIAGASISFGLLATTRKMCPPSVSAQEIAFLNALGAARTWSRMGNTLQLRDETNTLVLELIAKVSEGV